MLFALLLCALTAALWAPRILGPIDLRTDAAVYYMLGTSLAEDKGYVLTNEPGDMHAVQYPPGLPAFVAVVRLIVGTSDPQVLGPVLRIIYAFISLLYAVSFYAVSRQLLCPVLSFLAGVITSLFLQTYFLSNSLFAEIPFALVTMLFILAAKKSDRAGWFGLAGVLGAAAFLIRTAGVALLAAWVGEAALRGRWKLFLARAVVAAIPFFGWQLYVNSVISSAGYQQPAYEYQRAAYQYYNVPYAANVALIDPFQPEAGRITTRGVAERFLANLSKMPVTMGHCISTVPGYFEWTLRDARNWLGTPRMHPAVARIAPTFLGLLVIGGFVLLALRRQWLLVLYAAATIGLVCLTPWPVQFTRYLTPLTPILALAMLLFLDQVRRWLGGGPYTVANEPRAGSAMAGAGGAPAGKVDSSSAAAVQDGHRAGRFAWLGSAIIGTVVGGILLMQIYSLARAYRSGWTHVPAEVTRVGGGNLFFFDEKWMAYAHALEWLGRNGEPGALVAASTPQWVYLSSGFESIMPPMEIDRAEAQRLLEEAGVRYAVVEHADPGEIVRRYLLPTIEAHPEKWKLVYETEDGMGRVYERAR